MIRQHKILIIILLSILQSIQNQVIHQKKLFLTDDQLYLFFPHRNIQRISTYSSICRAFPEDFVHHHPSMTTVAHFNFNNTNLGINILQQINNAGTIFEYAKINMNGICTIYEVDQQQIRILYQYNFSGQFVNVIMIDKYHAFLWNSNSYLIMEYSLYNKVVILIRNNFTFEQSRKCQKYKINIMICWGLQEINFIIFNKNQFNISTYSWIDQQQIIRILLPLDKNQNIFFICTYTQCNTIQFHINNTIQILQKSWLPGQILGGDFNTQTNKIVIMHSSTAVIFTYNSRSHEIIEEQSIDLYSYVQCVFIENVRFLNEQILINCNNFMGQAQHIVLIRDRQLNRYFPYQPINTIDPNNPCLFDGNDRYIFAVCKKQIITKLNNLQFFQLSLKGQNQTITIQCENIQQYMLKIFQKFQISIYFGEYDKAYVNQLLDIQKILNYDNILTIKPKNKFTASAIDFYTLQSQNCPFILPIQYQNIQSIYFASLYIIQKCVQIVAADNRNFYRILQINQKLYYIQLCIEGKIGFGCQLQYIQQNIQNLRIFVLYYKIYMIYIQNNNLIIRLGNKIDTIFQSANDFQIRDKIIRVYSNHIYYRKSIINIINNCGNWIQQSDNYYYLIHQSPILKKYQKQLISHYYKQQTSSTFKFPFIILKGYYIFIITQTHINKIYLDQDLIVIYQLPYNRNLLSISDIRGVDNYIIIQYQLGFFQIYDIQKEAIAALIATQQQQILCDIILMDRDVILVPIRQQNYVLRIQTNPTITLGNFKPIYSKFHQKCIFQLTPHLSNGSCPNRGEDNIVSQIFNISIQFNIQKVDIQSQTMKINQPTSCNQCVFQIDTSNILGPIFTYEFNDDQFGAFQLIGHLNTENCQIQVENSLSNMNEIHLSDQNTRSQLLMMNKTHIILIDDNLKLIHKQSLEDIQYCTSYTIFQQYYLLYCYKYFILFSKDKSIIKIQHNLTVNYQLNYQIKNQYIKNNLYYIYILDRLVMHMFVINLDQFIIQYVSYQILDTPILDFAIVKDNIITLANQQICISITKIWNKICYNLSTFIPKHYAHDYQYQQILPYHTTQNYMKALLISKTSNNLHLDMEINFQSKGLQFTIFNAYAGYIGFTLKGIISINPQQNSYSNFILYYQDSNQLPIITYYKYNKNFEKNGYIGQIQSALFLQKYFNQPYNFTFLSFPHRLYINHISQLNLNKKYKKCLSIKVQDHIKAISTYQQPPLLKFLILKAININQLKPLYIKIIYIYDYQLLINTLIGFASWIVFFIIIAIATNRCKDHQSELTIHFMSDDLKNQYQEQNTKSDLLHSNSSPRSYTNSNDDDQVQ